MTFPTSSADLCFFPCFALLFFLSFLPSLPSRIDPVFDVQIPRGQNPPWRYSEYFGFGQASNSDILASQVIDKVGGFAMATMQNVLALKAKVAAIKNTAGAILTPTINAISLNILELGVAEIPKGKNGHDLTNPLSPNAWVSDSVKNRRMRSTLDNSNHSTLMHLFFLHLLFDIVTLFDSLFVL